MQAQRNESDYALTLAGQLRSGARTHQPTTAWRQGDDQAAFDVDLYDDGRPTGLIARVTITVSTGGTS